MTTTHELDLPVITPSALADQLGVTEKTLANWRSANRGPRFARTGTRGSAVFYHLDDMIIDWLDAQRVDTSLWVS